MGNGLPPCISSALNITKLVSEGAQNQTRLYDSKVHVLSSKRLQMEMNLVVLIFCLLHKDPRPRVTFEHGRFKRILDKKSTQPQNKAYHINTLRTVTPHHKTRVLLIEVLLILFLVQSCKCLKFTSNMGMFCTISIFGDF